MNEQIIRAQYEAKFGQPMTNQNYQSFLRLAEQFNIMFDSYEDFEQKLEQKIERISHMMS